MLVEIRFAVENTDVCCGTIICCMPSLAVIVFVCSLFVLLNDISVNLCGLSLVNIVCRWIVLVIIEFAMWNMLVVVVKGDRWSFAVSALTVCFAVLALRCIRLLRKKFGSSSLSMMFVLVIVVSVLLRL